MCVCVREREREGGKQTDRQAVRQTQSTGLVTTSLLFRRSETGNEADNASTNETVHGTEQRARRTSSSYWPTVLTLEQPPHESEIR